MTKREAIAQNKALRELLANVDALIGESLAEMDEDLDDDSEDDSEEG